MQHRENNEIGRFQRIESGQRGAVFAQRFLPVREWIVKLGVETVVFLVMNNIDYFGISQ